ncbi:DUF3871 family protein [Chryseobacterium manosquense]|uniref:DUF3871 family protein n=1 Tax=Chryseobacterium manosquense TaxID=2754694 RepID=A0A7H1DVA1_9FLAO|nr:DUF3871 family protein [Chryseobacterium manosquense]
MEDQKFSNINTLSESEISEIQSFPRLRSVRDIFLEDKDDDSIIASIRDDNDPEKAVITKDMIPFSFTREKEIEPINSNKVSSSTDSPFIIANTVDVTLPHLQNECIIPVFSKDNEKTIAHQEFIETVMNAISKEFPYQSISMPEIRVSHQIKGRTPDAIHLNVKDLLEHQKTIYYERMAFLIKIPGITSNINGNELSLCLGGVRSYNQQNLYSTKSLEKFKFFIGFQNKVCMNLCVWSDGYVEDLRASNTFEIQNKVLQVMQNYNAELHLREMKELTHDHLTEHQFAQLIGKSRLYQHLPKGEKLRIPELNFNDSHINTMAKDYYEDQNFSRTEDGRINLWNVFNLFTQANKSSYIDTFLDRNLNAFDFTRGLQKTLNGNLDYHWFLS